MYEYLSSCIGPAGVLGKHYLQLHKSKLSHKGRARMENLNQIRLTNKENNLYFTLFTAQITCPDPS